MYRILVEVNSIRFRQRGIWLRGVVGRYTFNLIEKEVKNTQFGQNTNKANTIRFMDFVKK
jgi:hypothetical protein